MEIINNLLHYSRWNYTPQPDKTKALTQRCLFLQITEEEAEKGILTSTLAPRFARPPHCTLRPSTRTRRAQDRAYPARFPAPSPPLSPPPPLAARSWAPTMTSGTTRPRILCRRRPGAKPALTVSPQPSPVRPPRTKKNRCHRPGERGGSDVRQRGRMWRGSRPRWSWTQPSTPRWTKSPPL